MFYGVRQDWSHLWAEAKATGRDWYYADNGYFPMDGRYFRIARNRVQAAQCQADYDRLARLDGRVLPWRRSGRHVLVCLQSDEFMATVAGCTDNLAALVRSHTDRPVRVRRKSASTPLVADLQDCWCLVTWASNAAVEAICAGVPAIVLGESAALAGRSLDGIESPPLPDDRVPWLARLAASQWTVGELADGVAWRALAAAG